MHSMHSRSNRFLLAASVRPPLRVVLPSTQMSPKVCKITGNQYVIFLEKTLNAVLSAIIER